MATRLDILAEAIMDVGGDIPEGYVQDTFSRLMQKVGPQHRPKILEQVPTEEVPTLRAEIRNALRVIKADLDHHPEHDPRSESEKAYDQSVLASYLLRERSPNWRTRNTKLPVKQILYDIGRFWWPHTYGKEPNADPERLAKLMITAADTMPDTTEDRRLYLRMEEGQVQVFTCATWAHYGFPMVQLASHRYAAALMATSIPSFIEIKAPWPAFLIELPTDLLETDFDGEFHPLTHVLVLVHKLISGQEVWSFTATGPHGINLWRWRLPLEVLREEPKNDHIRFGAFDLELTKKDDRTVFLITKLLLNVCIAMTDPDNVKPMGKHRRTASDGPRRFSKEPELRTYRVGKPIKLDVRPAIQGYLRGTLRTSPTVQFLVRGHWREQACGPKFSKHKTIWIEPYWKGESDSPILVRTHQLGDQHDE